MSLAIESKPGPAASMLTCYVQRTLATPSQKIIIDCLVDFVNHRFLHAIYDIFQKFHILFF